MSRPITLVLEGIDGVGKTTQAKALKKTLTERGFDVGIYQTPDSGTMDEYYNLVSRVKKGNFGYYIGNSEEEFRFCSITRNILSQNIEIRRSFTLLIVSLLEQIEVGKGLSEYKDLVHELWEEIVSQESMSKFLSIKAIASIFAMDRHENSDKLKKLMKENDIVLMDRCYLSNLCYQSVGMDSENTEMMEKFINKIEIRNKSKYPYDYIFLLTTENINNQQKDNLERSYYYQRIVQDKYKKILRCTDANQYARNIITIATDNLSIDQVTQNILNNFNKWK